MICVRYIFIDLLHVHYLTANKRISDNKIFKQTNKYYKQTDNSSYKCSTPRCRSVQTCFCLTCNINTNMPSFHIHPSIPETFVLLRSGHRPVNVDLCMCTLGKIVTSLNDMTSYRKIDNWFLVSCVKKKVYTCK